MMILDSGKEKNTSQSTMEESQGKLKLGGDNRRIKILKEIIELSHIPEFQDILSNVLDEIRVKYPEKIDEYRNLKRNLEKEFGEKIDEEGVKSKSFYFELNKVDDREFPSGARWELGEFKLNVKGQIVNMIFSEFISRIDQYETNSSKIQSDTVYSDPLNKWFQINFTKSSDNRVVGFVKILVEDNFVEVYNKGSMVKIAIKPSEILHKQKLIKLLEDNPGIGQGINLALNMLEVSTRSD